MAYFKKFPKINYSFDNGETVRTCVDILNRVAVRDKIKNITEMFTDYEVKEGERPEVLADRIYGDPELHWLILITNEIHNQYYDWPMSQRQLESFSSRKYPGSAYFINGVSGDGSTHFPQNVSYTRNDTLYGVAGGTYEISDGKITHITADMNQLARVHEWDKGYARLIVTGVSGSFSVGDYITSLTNSDGSTLYDVAQISRVVASSIDALHNFEDSDENHLNPLATPPNAGTAEQYLLGTADADGDIVAYGDTVLDNYINGSFDTYTLTNSQFEFRVNEGKRKIKLIRPEFVGRMAQEFEDVIQGNV